MSEIFDSSVHLCCLENVHLCLKTNNTSHSVLAITLLVRSANEEKKNPKTKNHKLSLRCEKTMVHTNSVDDSVHLLMR